MLLSLLMCSGLAALFFFFRWRNRVELKEAVALAVECGCDVERKGYHVYRSADGTFVVLNFQKLDGNFRDHEEVFDLLSDAVAKFIQRTGL